MRGWLAVSLLVAVAPSLSAQVGFAPSESPYRDLVYRRSWSVFGGAYGAQPDPVGIAPRSGTMFGMRYDGRITGPAYITLRVAEASLGHRIIDPVQPAGHRLVGDETLPIVFTDLALTMQLTGFKSWRSLVPLVTGGFGFSADLRGKNDVGGYRFGAPLTFTFGAGVQYVTHSTWGLRLDWTNYMYKINYPNSYFVRSGSDDPVRLPGEASSFWRRNPIFQLGLVHFFHP